MKLNDNFHRSLNLILFYWLPFIVWALIIFSFSASTTRPVSPSHWQDFIVKKSVHMIEYFVFAVLLFRALKNSGFNTRKSFYLAFILSVFYGFTDEYHQFFTPGREPRIRDVFFDEIGASLAVVSILHFLPRSSLNIKHFGKLLGLV